MLSEVCCNLYINLREGCYRPLQSTRRTPVADDPASALIVLPPACSERRNSIEKCRCTGPSHRPHHHKHRAVSSYPHTAAKLGDRREKTRLRENLPPGRNHPAVGYRTVPESEDFSRIIVWMEARDPLAAGSASHRQCQLRPITPFQIARRHLTDFRLALTDALDCILYYPPLRAKLGGIGDVLNLAAAAAIAIVMKAGRLDPLVRRTRNRAERSASE